MDDFHVLITKKFNKTEQFYNLETTIENIDLCNYSVGISEINYSYEFSTRTINFEFQKLLKFYDNFSDFFSTDLAQFDKLKLKYVYNSNLSIENVVDQLNQYIKFYSQAHRIEFVRQIEHAIYQKQFKKSIELVLSPNTFTYDKTTHELTGFLWVFNSFEYVYIFFKNYLYFEPLLLLFYNQDKKKILKDSDICYKFTKNEFDLFKNKFPENLKFKYYEICGVITKHEAEQKKHNQIYFTYKDKKQHIVTETQEIITVNSKFELNDLKAIRWLSNLYDLKICKNNCLNTLKVKFITNMNQIIVSVSEDISLEVSGVELAKTTQNLLYFDDESPDNHLHYFNMDFPNYLSISSNLINDYYYNNKLSNIMQIVPLKNSNDFKTTYYTTRNNSVNSINIKIEPVDSTGAIIKFNNNFISIKLHFKLLK